MNDLTMNDNVFSSALDAARALSKRAGPCPAPAANQPLPALQPPPVSGQAAYHLLPDLGDGRYLVVIDADGVQAVVDADDRLLIDALAVWEAHRALGTLSAKLHYLTGDRDRAVVERPIAPGGRPVDVDIATAARTDGPPAVPGRWLIDVRGGAIVRTVDAASLGLFDDADALRQIRHDLRIVATRLMALAGGVDNP